MREKREPGVEHPALFMSPREAYGLLDTFGVLS